MTNTISERRTPVLYIHNYGEHRLTDSWGSLRIIGDPWGSLDMGIPGDAWTRDPWGALGIPVKLNKGQCGGAEEHPSGSSR